MVPYTRGKHKEINIMTPKEVCDNQYHIYIRILVRINSHKVVAIIDSEATGNFIAENTATIHCHPTTHIASHHYQSQKGKLFPITFVHTHTHTHTHTSTRQQQYVWKYG